MTIEERLENMEKELRRVKRRNRWLLSAILLLVGGLVATGVFKTTVNSAQAQVAGKAQEIRAKSIVLEDESGKPRIMLGATTGLLLIDENGQFRAWLAATTGFALYDENSQIRVGLAATPTNSLRLDRTPLIAIKEGPSLTLYDENGKDRFVAGKTSTKSPDGKIIAYPESSLILYGPDGKVIWSAIK